MVEFEDEDAIEEALNRRAIEKLNAQLSTMGPMGNGIHRIQIEMDNCNNEPPELCVQVQCTYRSGLKRSFTILSEKCIRLSLARNKGDTDLWFPSSYPLILARQITPTSIYHCLQAYLNNEAYAALELGVNREVYDLYKDG